ncbi:MAG: S8/S53 family peptidase [Bacteroidales bacterium]|nr:S8/S53 family peptidase [Bacteroidales bacterium]
MKKTKIIVVALSILLLASALYNVIQVVYIKHAANFWHFDFKNANTRPTYDTYHHIKEAQTYATGKGIKVGILDHYFGYQNNKELYKDGVDFLNERDRMDNVGEHGLWLSTTLRELAPDVEIYAMNVTNNNRTKEKNALVKAVDWAIDKKLNILTYSSEIFRNEDRAEIDKAVQKAVANNILIIFLHYGSNDNLLPYSLLPYTVQEIYGRPFDVSVFHFDYNTFLAEDYKNYLKEGRIIKDYGGMPYFSYSSMPIVLASIASMMLEKDKNLSPSEIKKILISTSREMEYKNYKIRNVVDAVAAIKYVMNEKPSPPLGVDCFQRTNK